MNNMSYIEGSTGLFEYVIGLEVHAQIITKSKLFSNAEVMFGSSPNTQVSYVDAGFPGMLPRLNLEAVKQAIKTGLGIKGTVNKVSYFDRKNYFYADLPQGYQISQFYVPIVSDGHMVIKSVKEDEDAFEQNNEYYKKIRVNRIHIEQDAGKSFHDQYDEYSLIDLNRAGVGLMEIVTEPDLRSPEDALEYLKALRILLRTLGTCDGDMEKGSLRCDANVSVRRVGTKTLGTRCEIKNVNSIKNVTKAIEYEARRQIDLIESGQKVEQETRLFDASTGTTRTMRTKENANDYRYFRDPDILPLIVSDSMINDIIKDMPELYDAKVARYMSEYNISKYDAEILAEDESVSSYYEYIASKTDPKLSANWMISELFAYLNECGIEIKDCKITKDHLLELIELIKNQTISGKIAKTVFEDMKETFEMPKIIVNKKGLVQVTDTKAIEEIINKVLVQNQDKVNEYKSGKDKLFGFFVGLVMKESQGKANPSLLNDILKQKLSE
jgi:aspartyl-tRNA(Asn)/glutamyl-tRNA(Gln) amidotransferase subunit B